LSEQTHLTFRVSLQGRPILYETKARLGDKVVDPGSRISIGRHNFTLSHPKAKSYSTNLFVWYGERNLGDIVMERATGVLSLDVHPPAPLLYIHGPEFSIILTNSGGMTSAVPTDSYSVDANYAHWRERGDVEIPFGQTVVHRIAPKLGTISLICNRTEANFHLFNGENQVLESEFPAMVPELLEGTYKLIVLHHGNRWDERLLVKPGITNAVRIELEYGAAIFETEPMGAAISSTDGRNWGVTPIVLTELKPGAWQFKFELKGHEPMDFPVVIKAQETNSFHINLVSRTFALAMAQARRATETTNFSSAVEALTEALTEKPDDVTAKHMLERALLGVALQRADSKARQGDYTGALAAAEMAVSLSPEHEIAKRLVITYKRAMEEAELKDKEAQLQETIAARERRPLEYFHERMRRTMNSLLFDEQELKVKGTLADIEVKLKRALTNQEPVFKLQPVEHEGTDTFFLQAKQGMKLSGWRRLDLVAGQSRAGEVTIVFKVFEYTYSVVSSLQVLVAKVEDKDMIPIHESQLGSYDRNLLKRREEGVRLIRDRIRQDVGE